MVYLLITQHKCCAALHSMWDDHFRQNKVDGWLYISNFKFKLLYCIRRQILFGVECCSLYTHM